MTNWENCDNFYCNQWCYVGSNYMCGEATQLADGREYRGEWLQLSLPESIVLTSQLTCHDEDVTSAS